MHATESNVDPLPSSRPFPLAPRFDYGGLLGVEPGMRVWWSEDGQCFAGTVREAHEQSITRVLDGCSRSCRGSPEDRALLVQEDSLGPVLVSESCCRREQRPAA